MRILSFLMLSLTVLLINDIQAQHITIESTKAKWVYPKLGNPLKIIAEDIDCERLILRTDNGKVMKSGARCVLIFIPDRVGMAYLDIYQINGGDTVLVGKQSYRVKKWLPHKAMFGRYSDSDEMKSGEAKAHHGLRVPLQMGSGSGSIPLTSYKIQIVHNRELLAEAQNTRGRFSAKAYTIMRQHIRPGTRIYFTDIMIKMPGESALTRLEDICIYIR